MLSKSRFVLNLKAVIGQMGHNIIIVKIIFQRWCSQIAFFEEVDVEVLRVVLNMDEGPHSDIELTLSVEKGSFYIFLNYPLRILRLFS